jgi:hypothetical protein
MLGRASAKKRGKDFFAGIRAHFGIYCFAGEAGFK